MLMAGIAPVKVNGVQRNRLFTPGIVAGFKHGHPGVVRQGYDASQMVRMGIVHDGLPALRLHIDGCQAIGCTDVIQLFGYPVVNELFLGAKVTKLKRSHPCGQLLSFCFRLK